MRPVPTVMFGAEGYSFVRHCHIAAAFRQFLCHGFVLSQMIRDNRSGSWAVHHGPSGITRADLVVSEPLFDACVRNCTDGVIAVTNIIAVCFDSDPLYRSGSYNERSRRFIVRQLRVYPEFNQGDSNLVCYRLLRYSLAFAMPSFFLLASSRLQEFFSLLRGSCSRFCAADFGDCNIQPRRIANTWRGSQPLTFRVTAVFSSARL